ncbi:vacuolar protein sorting-associated protein 45 [Hyalella azteca]|uniref:Vacuolar protein sorting-associated protein 45 n=1 Tax=Hyalella azteca TaxID=294128 RepID=A0A8B7N3G7_HYAAZ|nr:vacuolar protein sorting-associated protein 45 [Hyalella azteca]XP_018007779.1 vacuolar protein sorting-associated protein 45 [Hyalella azteca]XP_018007780.1 vacuolar protein sorting-associated protein 45 [Hyalella azteca]
MGAVGAIKSYIETMIRDSEPGYKIMLMDRETTAIVSLVMAMSEVMKQEVYMFEQVEQMSSGENMSYLKCVVFVRPTPENISLLCRELQQPRYGAYYIYFSNVVSKASVKQLAESDEQELVREVQEIYADYMALAPHIFTLNIPRPITGMRWASGCLQRSMQGLTSLVFSLSLLPDVRYQANSDLARQLADEIRMMITMEGAVVASSSTGNSSYGFAQYNNSYNNSSNGAIPSSVVIILDRRDDPITPLLHQWTYEAMVHQLLGVNGGRVSLADVPGIAEELKEVVMTPTQDEFYAKSMYLNYGEIGQTIKQLMEEYQGKLSKQQKVESIADMKHFVQNYPQFKQMSGTVSKHVTVVGELSRVVSARRLLQVSECQQELVCGTDHSPNLQRVHELVRDPGISAEDAAVLVMLYAIRHQTHANNDTRGLVSALRKRSVNDRYIKLVSAMLEYGGEAARQSTLFSSPLPQDVSAFKKLLFKGVKGVENVYTQHKPLVLETATQAVKGRLKESSYPFIGTAPQNAAARPQTVILFIIGGATYEESAAIHQLNCTLASPAGGTATPSARVLLGGTHILNTPAFLESVEAAVEGTTRTSHRL